ncbi:MAG: acyl-ACP--UDP-N-acetylglucosamine O-acyltransferase [candidate division KSB1 bacterium]|nr:acyl-ACP--UDP-N-acetylglucosamine O-acyltransferase [candidate division KSB1 bacterium]MDZ7276487.1 acyl-ACP--UDP-N-acetylglucosamine O-acyltransferase [candidate division KSB1 bacterium]MDZ7286732.1 acyl-ACP--UDP-N-acetylglucosamine O-acyltransferase [candidate division KSB1 bacterium]MDZ7300257.1 acyl-ACP--UDP-N-acetylglucosamine O-acyltransferase [candidate division KSB1 bacterium]MDZ7308588.1 acyl-ACP--UDP-N-acetylglucosamine O-acyltransferase [candidate division KSB1 bacterium]
MANIHPTAIVDPAAEIASDVTIGAYAIVEANVQIGPGCEIKPHVHLASGTRLGRNCRVFTGAVIGSVPQDLKFGGEETTVHIGDRTTIREFATINRGTKDHRETRVGSDCLIMSYAHVAHDCIIGNHCILANAVNLAGHVVLEDWAGIGGMVPVHQFVRIGQHSFIGGGYRVSKDVPPYILAVNEPLIYAGLNAVGLRRRGFTEEQLLALKRAYKILFKSGLNVSQALARLRAAGELTPEVKAVIEFVEKSERGIIGGGHRHARGARAAAANDSDSD